jgi:FkbM family methyltransferase
VVHSYEPNTFLADKISNFQFSNNTLFNEAVGDRVSVTKLMMHSNTDSGSCAIKETIETVIKTKADWTNTVVSDIPMVDIETVLSRIGGTIDYLKMDCENSESLILLGKDLSKIRYIGIELHNQMGEENWNQLREWVARTHLGFPPYNGQHIETLLTRK